MGGSRWVNRRVVGERYDLGAGCRWVNGWVGGVDGR